MRAGAVSFVLLVVTVAFSAPLDQEVLLPTLRGLTGEKFVEGCKSIEHIHLDTWKADSWADLEKVSGCLGYIAGAIDQQAVVKTAVKTVHNYCIPDSVTGAQLAKVIVRYGDEHPEDLHLPAIILVNLALSKAFPCR